jgi:hypothetical protein
MTDRYDDIRVAPDPVRAEALRRQLHHRLAAAPRLDHRPSADPVKEIDVSPEPPVDETNQRRRLALAGAAAVVVLGVAAITVAVVRDGSDDVRDAPTTVSPSIATTVPPPASTAATETVVPTTSAEAQVRRVEIPGSPDWLAASDEGVWVKLDIGEVQLIDPDTATVEAEIAVASPDVAPCQGIGVGFGSVWSCSGSDVVRVDLEAREVVSRLALNKVSSQGHLVAHADRLWVLTGTGDTLVGVDPTTEQVVTTIQLPWRASDLGAGAAGLWALGASDGRALRVDPDSGAVLVDVALPDPVAISVGSQVWVGAKQMTVQLDATTGAMLTRISMGVGQFGAVAADQSSVWVRNTTDFVTRFDATTGEPAETYESDVTSGGDMLLAFGSVWTSAFDDSAVIVIPVD